VLRRRFPWLTREDMAVLAPFERHEPEMAAAWERFLEAQARGDRSFEAHETTAVDPGDVADQRQARARETGGGRKRPGHLTDD
jgi:hypothetical protein